MPSAGRRTAGRRRRRGPRAEIGEDVVERVLARVQVEDELLPRVGRGVLEERAAVARVVDRAKDGRRGDRVRRDVVVQIADVERRQLAEAPRARGDHLRGRGRHRDSEARARAVARRDRRRRRRDRAPRRRARARGPSVDDELGPVLEIGGGVGVRVLGPVRRPDARTAPPCRSQRQQSLGMLADEASHAARVPERVPREEAPVDDRRVVVRTTASGTYQRSQPGLAAR